MRPLLPPGWEWGRGPNAFRNDKGASCGGLTHDQAAAMAWARWEKDSGVTRAEWEALCMAESQRDEGRKAMCRWMAWHRAKHGTAFPPPHERPPWEAQKIEATGSWGAEEAVRLFG